MDFINAVIFGLVEGVTEFLPVSSTGHLILAARLMNLAETGFVKSFQIAIQLGAISAVIILYWNVIVVNRKVLKMVMTAFMPTALVGLIFYRVIKGVFFNSREIVLWSLFLGGIFLILFEIFHREKKAESSGLSEMSYGQAVAIGIFQLISIVPGVSRSAATICGGLILGINRKTVVEFSFLLAIPTMLAAVGLDLYKNAINFSLGQAGLLAVGFIISFGVAVISVKLLLGFVKRHNFIIFGVYRVAIALFFWLLIKG